MENLIKKLTEKEIEFVCSFANNFITQTPYVEPHNAHYLVKDYFIKRLIKKKDKLNKAGLELANSILKKNEE